MEKSIDIGKMIKAQLKQERISQKEFSAKMGWSDSQTSKKLSQRNVSAKDLFKIYNRTGLNFFQAISEIIDTDTHNKLIGTSIAYIPVPLNMLQVIGKVCDYCPNKPKYDINDLNNDINQ